MRPHKPHSRCSAQPGAIPLAFLIRSGVAFTLVELLASMTIIVILASILLPGLAKAKARALRTTCTANLREIGRAFHSYGTDHDGKFPMQVWGSKGGAAEHLGVVNMSPGVLTKGVSGMFRTLSNEVSTPKIFICPAEYEKNRTVATTWAFYQYQYGFVGIPFTNDCNTSYFVGVDAQEARPLMFLAGDHNLGNGDPPTRPFRDATGNHNSPFQSLGTNFPPGNLGVGWTDVMHKKRGNVLLVEGSVHHFNRQGLQLALQETGDNQKSAPWGVGPFIATAPNSPPGVNRVQLP